MCKNKTMNLKKIFLVICPLLFLIVGGITLKDYGVNWDEPYHFMRGQAYLHYFLTGQKDYKSTAPYPKLNPKCSDKISGNDCNISPAGAWDVINSSNKAGIYEDEIKGQYKSQFWRSIFQHDIYTYEYFLVNDDGHPPLADIASAFFNTVFYGNLHIIGDVESYHLFEIFTSTLLIGVVFLIVKKEFGIFPAITAAFALASYPLFFSESHFNIKDPVETSFYGLTLILFYLGIIKLQWKYIVVSAFFAGWALGTKFNIFFAVFIIVPWLILYFAILYFKNRKIKVSKKLLRKLIPIGISFVIYLPIAFGLLYILWPFLWDDPLGNFMKIVKFYKQIGTGVPGEMAKYIIRGWNTYPIVWIIITTPLPVLILSLFGVLESLLLAVKEKKSLGLLAILWFFIPILRVSYPGAGIYGGVRQIMEFVPALAILAGIGAYWLIKIFRGKVIYIAIIASLVFVGWEMVRIHPNENVYFNQLVGGLPGAKNLNIPYWGNTYGNVYAQGINWLNKNAVSDAKLGLPIATMGNVLRTKLRSDIDFWNGNWSGLNRAGEYEMEMYFDWPPKAWYSFAYYDVYLDPVYEAKVDGVTLLKIWKNDLQHTKKGFEKEVVYEPESVGVNKNQMTIDVGKEIQLTKVLISHNKTNCVPLKDGYIAISLDGETWAREPEPITTAQVPITTSVLNDKTFVFLFAAKPARYIMIDTLVGGSCVFANAKISISGLSK